MSNIRELLNFNGGYYEINREERNLAAIFYHVLLQEGNLDRFLKSIACTLPVKEDEIGIYFEYAFLRDLWDEIGKQGNETKRELILEGLKPSNGDDLERMSVYDFNQYFGAVPRPSRDFIQSPANWSISRYRENIIGNEEFLKACMFKWAFNAKPDIVIHTTNNHAVCIECKVESGEGTYPTAHEEVEEFKRRNLGKVTQTTVQKYIMDELLGIETQYLFLVQKPSAQSHTHTTKLWNDAFKSLKLDDCAPFIKKWIKRYE